MKWKLFINTNFMMMAVSATDDGSGNDNDDDDGDKHLQSLTVMGAR